jgi:NAD(P)H-hydrate epimerase
MKVASADEIRRIDRTAIEEYGIPGAVLMENAGVGVVRIAEECFGPLSGKTVTIVCGKGNNGGDGFVAARHLLNRGIEVRVYLLAHVNDLSGDARANLDIFKKMGGDLFEKESFDGTQLRSALMHSHLILDALLGTGVTSSVREDFAETIGLINQAATAGKNVLSVDIPSGIHADTGAVLGSAIRATLTVSLALPKRGHYLFPGASYRGRLRIQDIGIPAALMAQSGIQVELMEESHISALLPSRPQDAHKGHFGHVLVVAGSTGKSGAAALTALACLRAGAGLVTLAAPRSVQPLLASKLTEVMTFPLPETGEGTISLEAEKVLKELAEGKDAVAIGPGLTTRGETLELVRKFLPSVSAPVIVDADAIHALGERFDILRGRKGPTLLTPHPGEMAGLLRKTSKEVQDRRIETVQEFCSRQNCFLVLKGAYTLVGGPDGRVFINPTGNPGMATAGSGDVLTGIIAGFSAQGLDPLSAAKAGVFIHGLAGDLAAHEIGEAGLIAGDIIDRIPRGVKRCSQPKKS